MIKEEQFKQEVKYDISGVEWQLYSAGMKKLIGLIWSDVVDIAK